MHGYQNGMQCWAGETEKGFLLCRDITAYTCEVDASPLHWQQEIFFLAAKWMQGQF